MECVTLLAKCALWLLMMDTCWGLQQQPYIFSDGEQVQNVFSSGVQLIVGTNRALYNIETSNGFVQRQNRSLQGPNSLLVKANEGIYNNLLVSCDSSTCILASISNFNSISWSVASSSVLRAGTTNAPGLFALSSGGDPELLYVNSATGNMPVRVVRGSLANVNLPVGPPSNSEFRRMAVINEAVVEIGYQFHLEFSHNGFLYLIADRHRDEPDPLTTARVVRLCSTDSSMGITFFRSHMEVKLACGGSTSAISSATFVNGSDNPFSEPTLVISTLGSPAVICTYNLSSIDGAMQEKFDECQRGDGKAGFPRYGDTQLVQCRDFTQDQQAVSPTRNLQYSGIGDVCFI